MVRMRSFRKTEIAFVFGTNETGNRNQRAVWSTAMIVSIDVDSSWMIAVRARSSLRKVGFTRQRVICFCYGRGVPLFN